MLNAMLSLLSVRGLGLRLVFSAAGLVLYLRLSRRRVRIRVVLLGNRRVM